jgi:cellobiose phosphorylase
VLEPYVYGQFVEGKDSPFAGRAHVHWLTGTASTVMVGTVEGILGMRPNSDGLAIDPSIPCDWKEFEIQKVFRGKKLHISVKNPSGKESGVTKMILNGQEISGNFVDAGQLLDVNEIEVIM